jgi:hypothetical protein
LTKLVQSATIIAEALLAMYSDSAKVYFAAWIGENWPALRKTVSLTRRPGFSWLSFRGAGVLTNDARLPVIETASLDRIEAPRLTS